MVKKNIDFINIIAFIRRAMNEDCDMLISNNGLSIYREIGPDEDKNFAFSWIEEDDKITILVDSYSIYKDEYSYTVELTDATEILQWKLLLEEIKKRNINKTEERFTNFFKEPPKKVDINDLDNDDE